MVSLVTMSCHTGRLLLNDLIDKNTNLFELAHLISGLLILPENVAMNKMRAQRTTHLRNTPTQALGLASRSCDPDSSMERSEAMSLEEHKTKFSLEPTEGDFMSNRWFRTLHWRQRDDVRLYVNHIIA